jgi:cell division protein FtsB
MRIVLGKNGTYFLVLALTGLTVLGALMIGEQGLTHKRRLFHKRSLLEQESRELAREIGDLERRLMLLRSDAAFIEKVAKRKLGMARPSETVYIFDGPNSSPAAGF